jgi:hypothetical protein
MNRSCAFVLAFTLGLPIMVPAATVSQYVQVSVDLTAGEPIDGQPTLKATLTNTGDKPFSVYEYLLPWGNRYSITLLAVPQHAQPIPLSFSIDDPLQAEVAVKPGETIEGNIRLDLFCGDIALTLRRVPLLVLWSYQLKTRDGKESPRLAGSLQLPATVNGTPLGH